MAEQQLTPVKQIQAALERAVLKLIPEAPELAQSIATLDRPKQAEHGDFACNAAMALTKQLKQPPREIATQLVAALQSELGDCVSGLEIAGPGFVNIKLSSEFLDYSIDETIKGEKFGSGGQSENIHLEFVSNNPTGPVHIGGARGASYGSSLANLLEYAGNQVYREYYINDFGNQVNLFGQSLKARALGELPPSDGYQGEYIADVAAQIPDSSTLGNDELALAGIERMVAMQKQSLVRFRTEFDRWFSERSLHQIDKGSGKSKVDEAFDLLEQQGRTYRSEEALFLRTTEFADDKDRVLIRSDGRTTYFASDVAYHHDKRMRGYDRIINVLGADHHGYVARVEAAFQALGGDVDKIELLITQNVNLWEDGERAKMSKRAGEFVALDDLVDDIGVDAARWFLLSRSHDTTIDLDLNQARQESSENPVYYVQYAHARIASILRRSGATKRELQPGAAGEFHASERALLLALLEWPNEVQEAATRRSPHRISTYSLALARTFSAFYRDCKVLADDVEPAAQSRRLGLCQLTINVLADSLAILGVDAPDQMSNDQATA